MAEKQIGAASAHRPGKPVGVVDKLGSGQALGTEVPPAGRAFGIAAHLLNASIGVQMDQYLADTVAPAAGCPDNPFTADHGQNSFADFSVSLL
jgi:hypothetical protein